MDEARPDAAPADTANHCPACAEGIPLNADGVHVSEDGRWWEPCKKRAKPSPA